MNVYDFDKTIYAGDSTVDFYLFCVKKNPRLLQCLPRQGMAMIQYYCGRIPKKQFKQEFFCFLQKLPQAEVLVQSFWQQNQKKIEPWYLSQKKKTDVVISASPEFLLQPIAAMLDISLIATKVEIKTGVFQSENCYAQEKVYRFQQMYQMQQIENFYSDSASDAPMAKLAQRAHLVQKHQLTEWNTEGV